MAGVRIALNSKEAEMAARKLRKDLADLGLTTKKTETQIKGLEDRFKRGLEARKAERAVERVEKSLKATRLEAIKLKMQMGDIGGAFKMVGQQAGKFKDGLFGLKAAFAALGIGLVAKQIYDLGSSFSQTMAIVQGVTRASADEFVAMEEIARRMGATTEWTATQAAESLRFLGMAGFEAAEAIKALPGTLDLATAGNLDLGRAADIATNALTAMGLEVEQLTRVNDVFVGTITRTNVDMEMMAEAFKYSAPKAKAFGYDIELLSAMIGPVSYTHLRAHET